MAVEELYLENVFAFVNRHELWMVEREFDLETKGPEPRYSPVEFQFIWCLTWNQSDNDVPILFQTLSESDRLVICHEGFLQIPAGITYLELIKAQIYNFFRVLERHLSIIADLLHFWPWNLLLSDTISRRILHVLRHLLFLRTPLNEVKGFI